MASETTFPHAVRVSMCSAIAQDVADGPGEDVRAGGEPLVTARAHNPPPVAGRHGRTVRAVLWGILVACAIPCGAWGGGPEAVARVNGEPVTRDELQRVLADSLVRRQLEHEAGAEKTDSKALERLAVRKLISRHLLLQEAVRRGVTVSEQDVDKAVGDLRRRFDDLKEFAAWLTSRGLDDKSLFASVRTELLMTRVSAALVEDVGVTEEQVRQYYEGRKGNLKTAEGVRLRVIAAKDRAAADGILAALKTGASFEDLARTRSTFRPEQGGNIGWIGLQAVPPPVRAVIVTLKAGESGGPVQHGAGYLLVRLEERRPSRPATLAEARPEIRRRLVAAKRQQVLQAWLTEQEKKSHSEVINQ